MAGTTARRRTAQAAPTHLLEHLIPDSVFGEEYISRRVHRVLDLDVLRYAKAARDNVMVFGPTGPGKTSMVLAYGAVDRIPVVTVQSNGAVDPNTFFGGWTTDEATGAFKWQDSEITEVIRHGGVLYLDEVNFLPAKVASVFHSLLDKRRMITILERGNEVVHAHPDLQVIVAYNPDYEGTKPLNAAFKNRFKIKMRFDYDREVEAALVCLPVMLDVAQRLRGAARDGVLDTPTSTNMLVEFEILAVDFSYDFAVDNFLNAFPDDERNAVEEVFGLFGDAIKEQLAEMERLAAEQNTAATP